MTSTQLRDDRGREGRTAARSVAFAVEVLSDRGVVSTRLDQVADPRHHATLPIRIADRDDRHADRSLTDQAATPRDPDRHHAGLVAIQVDARYQRAEQRLSCL